MGEMEVRVRVESLSKLKLAMSSDKDGALVTQVSFEIPGKIESAARMLNLIKQKQPMYCVIGCAQARFDLQVVEVFEKDKRAAQSEADKALAAGEEPTMDLPTFRVIHLESKDSWEGLAMSPEAACEQAGWPPEECTIKRRTAKGGWAKAEVSAEAPVEEAPPAEATGADNGRGDAADIGAALDSLSAWLDANAQEDASGEYYIDCPFHEDKQRSLCINREQDLYECTVCGSTGNLMRLAERLGLVKEEATAGSM